MTDGFSFPPPSQLHRLNVHDNLTINADRWRFAHGYHQQRQRLHYQSLFQPGIVYGLGVKVVSAPAESRFKDARWLEVQPGMAIDYQGNFIIVSGSQDRTYRLALPDPQQSPTTVYLVIKYVDPDDLELPEQPEHLPEQFRLDETTVTPNPNLGEVELCRIDLEVGQVALAMPDQVLQPESGQPNLLYRAAAQLRSQVYLSVGLLSPQPARTIDAFRQLQTGTQALYPNLQFSIDEVSDFSALSRYGLVYAQPQHLSAIGQKGQQALQTFTQSGGTLLVESPDLGGFEQLQTFFQQRWNIANWSAVTPSHDLLSRPFLFPRIPYLYCSSEPSTGGEPAPLTMVQSSHASDGVLLLTPDLTSLWAGRSVAPPAHAREQVRMSHELGINLLQYVYTRAQIYQLLA